MDFKKAIHFFIEQGFVIDPDPQDPRGLLLEHLLSGNLPEEKWREWCQTEVGLPLLKDEFFTQFKPNLEFWENCQGILPWDQGFLPLVLWDNQVVSIGLLPPDSTEYSTGFIFLLSSKAQLQQLWNFYQGSSSERAVEISEELPTQTRIHAPPQDQKIQTTSVEPSLDTQDTSSTLNKPKIPDDPAALFELADNQEGESEESTEESSENEESEESETGAPEGLAPEGLVLTGLPESPLKSGSAGKLEPLNQEKSKDHSPLQAETNPLEGALPPLDSPIDDNDTVLPPPAPPEAPPLSLMKDAENQMHQEKVVAASESLSKLSAIALEKIKRHDLCQIIPLKELEAKLTQFCETLETPYERVFFGLVQPDQKQLQVAMIKPFDDHPSWLDAPPLSLQTPSICTIAMKTLKSFYGTPIRNPLNQKIYDLALESKNPEIIAIIPLIQSDRTIGLVGVSVAKSQYNLEHLVMLENHLREAFKNYDDIKVTDLGKTA